MAPVGSIRPGVIVVPLGKPHGDAAQPVRRGLGLAATDQRGEQRGQEARSPRRIGQEVEDERVVVEPAGKHRSRRPVLGWMEPARLVAAARLRSSCYLLLAPLERGDARTDRVVNLPLGAATALLVGC